MPLVKEDMAEIGEYIRSHLAEWLAEQSLGKPPLVYEIELRERMVRVEEELKNQRELMKQGFEQVDKRFEQMNKRLDDLSRRMFQFMIWSFGFTATAAGIIIAFLKL